MNIFDELQTSLQEAVEIKQGKTQESRVTRHEVAEVQSYSGQSSCISGRIRPLHGHQCGHHQKLRNQARNPTGD